MKNSFQEKVYPVRKSKKSIKREKLKFSNGVYQAVRKIPKGKVLSYKQVADLAGFPNAFQAVGNTLAKNPFWPKVPCHPDDSVGIPTVASGSSNLFKWQSWQLVRKRRQG